MKRDSINKNHVSPKHSTTISPQLNLRKMIKRKSDVFPLQIDSNRFKAKKNISGIVDNGIKKLAEADNDELHSSESKNSKHITSLENVENAASSPITNKNDSPRAQKFNGLKSFSPTRTNSFVNMNIRK